MWDRSTSTSYEIRVEGILSNEWSDWLGGLAITPYDAHTTLIAGPVPDQAALFGILAQLHALNVTLIAVQRVVEPIRADLRPDATGDNQAALADAPRPS